MSSDVYRRIQRHPKFQELVQRRSSFSWLLSFLVLGLFYGFILLVAFNPGPFTANANLRQTARLTEADGTGRRCHC